MTRRLVLAMTTAALLAGGAGIASAAEKGSAPAGVSDKQHQFCIIIYDANNVPQRYFCINW